MDDVTRLLEQLVALPSVNPMGRALAGPEYLEGRVTDFLESCFRAWKLDYQRQSVIPGRDNIVAVFESRTSRRRLLWDAHQDTVPVDGMTIPPFEPRIEGSRLYGRGSCDVKAGLAAMLIALRQLVDQRPPEAAGVILACTIDEEYTHLGSSHLAANPLGADLAIVAEPTQLDLVTTHKGSVRWKIRTAGRACHSSTPGLGDNAIYRMARVVSQLAELARELEQAPAAPLLGPPSLSVGRVEGGSSVNIVPDFCSIEVDRRLLPGERGEEAHAAVVAQLRDRLPADAPAITFDPPWIDLPPLSCRVDPGDQSKLLGVIERVTERRAAVIGVPYGTDAGPLNHVMPCVVLGPGDIAQAHTRDEWVDLRQVRQAVRIYHDLAIALGA